MTGEAGFTSEETEARKQKSQGFYMGVDLGQARDYTAIVVIEMVRFTSGQELVTELHLRHCERLPLGTSYEDITRHIKNLLMPFEDEKRELTLIVDATGVGRPVIDSFKEDHLEPVPITVTGGLTASYDKGEWHVPKRDLVAAAKVLLGKGQLKIAQGMPFGAVLINDLQNFHVKVNLNTGHDSYEAWREGARDDLVFAVSLACWYALKQKKKKRITGVMPIIGKVEKRRDWMML
jgi:hypothetical protein